jgi:hypothetical protein
MRWEHYLTEHPITYAVALAVLLAFLSGCQTSPVSDNSAAVVLLQRVNANAHTCWIRSKDKDFRGYSLIPELDTRAGKPRILVVRTKASQGLPKLVIEADGTPPRVTAYGPLADGPLSARIKADVDRWTAGGSSC